MSIVERVPSKLVDGQLRLEHERGSKLEENDTDVEFIPIEIATTVSITGCIRHSPQSFVLCSAQSVIYKPITTCPFILIPGSAGIVQLSLSANRNQRVQYPRRRTCSGAVRQ